MFSYYFFSYLRILLLLSFSFLCFFQNLLCFIQFDYDIFLSKKNIYIYISLCWIVSGERPFVNFIYPSACLSNNYPNVPPNIYFFTWIPVLGYGILQGESVGKKFRDAFFPRVMVLGRHFLALGPWRRLIL